MSTEKRMSYDDLPYFRDQILERIDSLKCFLSNTPADGKPDDCLHRISNRRATEAG